MYKKLMKHLEKYGFIKTITVLNGRYIGTKILVYNNKIKEIFGDIPKEKAITFVKSFKEINQSIVKTINKTRLLLEYTKDIPHMIVLGGGHVSLSFCPIASKMGFVLTVVEERKRFCTKKRFPNADKLICASFEEAFKQIPNLKNSYYVIVTCGHKFDNYCLREILKRDYEYCGMIGSKKKLKIVLDDILKDGYDEKKVRAVNAPIGIPLGGNLPIEVAVSIAAKIISVRNKTILNEIDYNIKNHILNTHKLSGVMVTIIKKTGSSPRGIGSKMIVFRNLKILGSIGGGLIEYKAMLYAKDLHETKIKTYYLSNKDAAEAGSVCGGCIEVIFEPFD